MPRKNIQLDPNEMQRYRAAGHGSGHGLEYKPHIRAASVKVHGNKTRWIGMTTGREHQVLSTPEYYVGNIADFCPRVKKIREQFPLWPIEQTIEIADELGVEHPNHSARGRKAKYTLMTTDFLFDIETDTGIETIARTVKLHKHLDDPRILEKLEIERIYWANREIDWGIITELDYNKTVATNIAEVLRPHRTLEGRMDITDKELARLSHELTHMVQERDEALSAILREFERQNNIPQGEAISLPWFLIANRKWTADLTKKLTASRKLELLSTSLE